MLILHVLEEFNPIIRNPHGETIVEPDATLRTGCREAWHAAHLLRDGDGVRSNLMDNLVSESEVCHGVLVHVSTKVMVIRADA
jgi:hypothetical protein